MIWYDIEDRTLMLSEPPLAKLLDAPFWAVDSADLPVPSKDSQYLYLTGQELQLPSALHEGITQHERQDQCVPDCLTVTVKYLSGYNFKPGRYYSTTAYLSLSNMCFLSEAADYLLSCCTRPNARVTTIALPGGVVAPAESIRSDGLYGVRCVTRSDGSVYLALTVKQIKDGAGRVKSVNMPIWNLDGVMSFIATVSLHGIPEAIRKSTAFKTGGIKVLPRALTAETIAVFGTQRKVSKALSDVADRLCKESLESDPVATDQWRLADAVDTYASLSLFREYAQGLTKQASLRKVARHEKIVLKRIKELSNAESAKALKRGISLYLPGKMRQTYRFYGKP